LGSFVEALRAGPWDGEPSQDAMGYASTRNGGRLPNDLVDPRLREVIPRSHLPADDFDMRCTTEEPA